MGEIESEEQRVNRATALAEQRVRRDTIVDNRLDGHDRRLASINGQLARGAAASELVAERMSRLEQTVVALRTDLATKRAVDDALRERTARITSQQITRREFWLGITTIVVAILSVAVQAGLI